MGLNEACLGMSDLNDQRLEILVLEMRELEMTETICMLKTEVLIIVVMSDI